LWAVPDAESAIDLELPAIVERELAALPERFRLPVALCDLDGRSRAEAAGLLGIPEGTVSSRLHTGRKLLATRLRRYTGAGALLAGSAVAAPLPWPLAERTARAVADCPPAITALASGVCRAMTAKPKLLLSAAVAAFALGALATVLLAGSPGQPPAPKAQPVPKAEPVPAQPVAATADWPVFRGGPQMLGTGSAKLPAELDEIWAFKTGNTVEGAPAVVKDVVYIASADGHLYAVGLKTGKQIWKTKLATMKASPAVKDGKVYVGDGDGTVHCVDAATGKALWKFATDGEITSGCNFHGDNILVGSHDSNLYCLSPDGKKLWNFTIDGPVNGSPAVIGDTAFVAGCDSNFHAVDCKTGKAQWNVALPGQAAATAAVTADFAFVGTMSNDVVAVDLKTKKVGWQFTPERRAQPFYASAAVTDSLVLTGSRDKKVYALDRKTGKEVWSFAAEGMVDASPTVVGDRVYVGCQSTTGEFYVLDLKTGKKLQELTLDSAVSGSVSVAGDRLLVGTEKGSVYCLGKK
jgi:outer membrane protein assembly factor BamB